MRHVFYFAAICVLFPISVGMFRNLLGYDTPASHYELSEMLGQCDPVGQGYSTSQLYSMSRVDAREEKARCEDLMLERATRDAKGYEERDRASLIHFRANDQ